MSQDTNPQAVPVVLPVIRIDDICGGAEFVLSADLGDADSPRGERVAGAQLGQRIAELVHTAGTSVRVEVHDADGTVHADILDPTALPAPPAGSPSDGTAPEPSNAVGTDPPAGGSEGGAEQLWIRETGWEPGDSILVCVALATCTADADGVLQTRISLDWPPQDEGKVVLVRSSTVAVRAWLPPRS